MEGTLCEGVWLYQQKLNLEGAKGTFVLRIRGHRETRRMDEV